MCTCKHIYIYIHTYSGRDGGGGMTGSRHLARGQQRRLLRRRRLRGCSERGELGLPRRDPSARLGEPGRLPVDRRAARLGKLRARETAALQPLEAGGRGGHAGVDARGRRLVRAVAAVADPVADVRRWDRTRHVWLVCAAASCRLGLGCWGVSRACGSGESKRAHVKTVSGHAPVRGSSAPSRQSQ